MKQQKWLFSSSKRKGKPRRHERSWLAIVLTVAAVSLALWCAHSLADLAQVRRMLQQTLSGRDRDKKSVTEHWQAARTKLEEGHGELEDLKQRHELLTSELQRTEKTLLEEKENCKFELQNLEIEWKGKAELLKEENSYSKEEKLLQLEDEMKRLEEKHAEELNPLRRSEHALRSELAELARKHVAIERERVLGRILEKTSDAYLNAFFDRLRKGSYKGVYVQTRENENKSSSRMKQDKDRDHNSNNSSKEDLQSVVVSSTEEHERVLPDKVDPFGNEHFPHGGYWPTCAVVGGSGLLLKYEHGSVIDRHDAVFRFDEAPTKAFEKHVGSKTTVRIVSDAKHVEARQYAQSHMREMVLQQVDTAQTLDNFTSYMLTEQHGTFNLHRLAPDYKKFIRRFFTVGIGVDVPLGFYGVALAMQKCHKVSVYGFTHSPHKNFMKRSYYHSKNGDLSPATNMNMAAVSSSSSSSGVDLDELNMVLISELSHRLRDKTSGDRIVEIAEPCQSVQESFQYCTETNTGGMGRNLDNDGAGECVSYSSVVLSTGGECVPHVPYPVPREGFCYLSRPTGTGARTGAGDDDMSQVYMTKMERANCFVKCDANESCPGGFQAPPCEAQDKTCSVE